MPVVAAMFPDAVVVAGVDRDRLGRAVFGDRAALAALEAAVHPLVAAERDRFLRRACRRGVRLAVVDVPLLFETGAERGVDASCVVSAPAFVQEARVLRRPGMTRDRLESVRARQMPDAEKRRRGRHRHPHGAFQAATWRGVGRVAADLGTRRGGIWPPRPTRGPVAASGRTV